MIDSRRKKNRQIIKGCLFWCQLLTDEFYSTFPMVKSGKMKLLKQEYILHLLDDFLEYLSVRFFSNVRLFFRSVHMIE